MVHCLQISLALVPFSQNLASDLAFDVGQRGFVEELVVPIEQFVGNAELLEDLDVLPAVLALMARLHAVTWRY